MSKYKSIFILVYICILFSSCTINTIENDVTIDSSDKTLTGPKYYFKNNQYIGFDDLDRKLIVLEQEAIGYVIIKEQAIVANRKVLESFIESSNEGVESNIRIAKSYEDNNDVTYKDLHYDKDGYSMFYEDQESFEKITYKHLLILEGKWGMPAKESRMIVLSDRKDLTHQEVTSAMVSSSTDYIDSVGRHKIVLFNYDKEAVDVENEPMERVEITTDNWINHEDIVEIRDIYYYIESYITNDDVIVKTKEDSYDVPYEPTYKELYLSNENKVIKYYEEAGSDDSAIATSYYYDSAGSLRFVFITGGAVNGTSIEHRIYFNENGDNIWEIQRLIEGPGYTFSTIWPEESYIYDPIERFEPNLNLVTKEEPISLVGLIVDANSEWNELVMEPFDLAPPKSEGFTYSNADKKLVLEVTNNSGEPLTDVLITYEVIAYKNEIEFGIDRADVIDYYPVIHKQAIQEWKIESIAKGDVIKKDVFFMGTYPQVEVNLLSITMSGNNLIDSKKVITKYRHGEFEYLEDSQHLRKMLGVY